MTALSQSMPSVSAIAPESPAIFEPLAARHERIRNGQLDWSDWLKILNRHIQENDPIYKGIAEWFPLDTDHYPRDSQQSSIPFLGLYKDTIDVAGFTTRLGSSTGYRKYPVQSAQFIRELHTQAVYCTGKAATLEFGLTPKTFCVNPRYPMYSPGGSSTGSGVTVAAGFCDFSIGTDAGGSIRHPAGQCGVVGLKLSFQARWHDGVFPSSPHLDSLGIITRRAADMAYLWEQAHLTRTFNLQPDTTFKGGERPRIGVLTSVDNSAGYDADVWQNWQDVKARLSDADFELIPVNPAWWSYAGQGWPLLLREVFLANNTYRQRGEIDYDDFAWESIRLGEEISPEEHQAILDTQVEACRVVDDFFAQSNLDVLLLPLDKHLPRHLSVPPPDVYVPGPHMDETGFTMLANFVHIPAMALHSGVTEQGAPLAFQLWGRSGFDARLVRAATSIERALQQEGLID